MSTSSLTPIKDILPAVCEAGDEAKRFQLEKEGIHSERKKDKTLVTEVDRKVERKITQAIHNAFPNAGIVGEEYGEDSGKSFMTFVVDPIDGTDVFRQGLFGWCVSVGMLDAEGKPVAGVVYAPRLNLLLTTEPGGPVESHGDFAVRDRIESHIDSQANIMVTSRAHQQVDLQDFPGKMRSLGSAALHIVSPMVFSNVVGTVERSGQYAWDIVGAHALIASHGLVATYVSGQNVDYGSIIEGARTNEVLLAGPPDFISSIPSYIQISN